MTRKDNAQPSLRPLAAMAMATLTGLATAASGQTMGASQARICMPVTEWVQPAPAECGFNDLGANVGLFAVSSTDWGDGRGCVQTRLLLRCLGP